MTDTPDPYNTRLDIQHGPLETVVEGQLLIDLEGRTVALDPLQGFVVPKGVRHRTRAPGRTIILMVENAGIVPTGD